MLEQKLRSCCIFQFLILRLGDTPDEDEIFPWDGRNHVSEE